MITPRTQTAIAVLKCIYARDYGTCIKPCTLTEGQMRILLPQLTNAGLIILKDAENPLETQSYTPARKAVEISLLDILEATGEHLNCNRPITEQFYAQYGRAAQKLGIINHLEATGEHLNCNRPITEQFYAQYGRAAQKLGIINQIARIYLKEITLTDL